MLQELMDAADWISGQPALAAVSLDYRVKSEDSILLKYERYYPDHQARKVFNDILGFRAFCDDYKALLTLENTNSQLDHSNQPEKGGATVKKIKIVDMTQGKANDDGYRGVHVYYQESNFHYPIEIQFNTFYDRQMNNWLHDFVYKHGYPNEVGKMMLPLYECGKIKNIAEFKAELAVSRNCE